MCRRSTARCGTRTSRRCSADSAPMAFTRDDLRDSVERAGDEHWKALRDHHEDAYPNPKPTPGDVCKGEAERLNGMGLGNAQEFALVETRVERAGERGGVHQWSFSGRYTFGFF